MSIDDKSHLFFYPPTEEQYLNACRNQERIQRMTELYPEWFRIINGCMMDSYIHGWKPDDKDSKIVSEFAQLMKGLGITKNMEGNPHD